MDILVVGAGPVGSYIALKLSRLGYEVIVVERKKDTRDNVCCTGIISPSCFELLPVGTHYRKLDQIVFNFPGGAKYILSRDFYIIDRPLLNHNLMEEAKKAGTKYYFGNLYKEREREGKGITVLALGGKPTNGQRTWIGMQYKVTPSPSGVEVYPDKEGFGWITPTLDGFGFVGSIGKYNLTELLVDKEIISKQVKVLPFGPASKTYWGRTLSVGEYAGQVKTTTGGGLYFGFLCADIAVEVIYRGLPFSEYERRWRREIGFDLWKGIAAWKIYKYLLPNKLVPYLFPFFKSFDKPI